MQQVERALHSLPVLQVEEGVGDGLTVAALQDVFWREDETLHLQEILGDGTVRGQVRGEPVPQREHHIITEP